MASDEKWYCLSQDGVATLCTDHDDAEANAKVSNRVSPMYAPHRAVQLVDAAEIDALKARIAELEAQNAELRNATLEEAAVICDGLNNCLHSDALAFAASMCATRIRRVKS